MLYTFLISIVFIAEIIITIAIFKGLLNLDKIIINLDKKITDLKPDIKDICELGKKISEQLEILAQDFVEKTKQKSEDMFLRHLSKALIALLALNLNFKIIKKIRSSKITKNLAKGLSLIENMI